MTTVFSFKPSSSENMFDSATGSRLFSKMGHTSTKYATIKIKLV